MTNPRCYLTIADLLEFGIICTTDFVLPLLRPPLPWRERTLMSRPSRHMEPLYAGTDRSVAGTLVFPAWLPSLLLY